MGKRNYTLAGHHMTNPNILFSPLQNIKTGDTIYLINKSKKSIFLPCDYQKKLFQNIKQVILKMLVKKR